MVDATTRAITATASGPRAEALIEGWRPILYALRKSNSARFTTAGCSDCTKWPLPGT